MNIVFLTRRFYPDIGGVEKHVHKLTQELQKQGHSITVISEKSAKTTHKQSNATSAKSLGRAVGFISLKIPINVSEKQKKWTIWKWLIAHKQVFADADVIHCHDVFFWYLPFRFIYPNKKVYITFHGYEGYPISRKAIMIRKLSELLSHGNICIGDFIKTWYGTSPTYISYGAVDTPPKKVEQVTNPSAVFIGRLDDQTGIDMYIKSYELIKKKQSNFTFNIIGDGPYEKLIPKQVKHTGFKNNAEDYFLQGRYAFVSRYLSILEAMVRRRLVFAVYDNPIKRDYLKKSPMAAFMVVAHTPEEIADAVNYYLLHPKNEQDHIEHAYKWATEQTWENMANLYLKLWKYKM